MVRAMQAEGTVEPGHFIITAGLPSEIDAESGGFTVEQASRGYKKTGPLGADRLVWN